MNDRFHSVRLGPESFTEALAHDSAASDRNVKAGIAAGIADLCNPGERVAAVAGTLRVDEVEARLLISRGRRLARQKGERV